MSETVIDSLSARQARRMALAAQGFGKRTDSAPTWRRMSGMLDAMGLLQIDSVCVLCRSHYLPLFSRLGPYPMASLDRKTFDPRHRRYFEYWAHEASLLPVETQPLLRWRMERARQGQDIWNVIASFGREHAGYVGEVRRQVADRGPLRVRDLADPGPRGKAMWARNKGKIALEYLFWIGEVTAATRRGFERVYDLSERVLPAEVMAAPTPDDAEAQRALLRIAARAHGVATEADLRDYFRLPAKDSKPRVSELVEAGDLLPVAVEGWSQPAYLDPDARLPRWVRGSALLSPFDPLIWERSRTERLFDFHYRLEIYTPAAERRFGYYVLPFLLDGALVARVDLKADRIAGRLLVQAAHGEPGIEPGRVAEALAEELRRLALWQDLESVAVTRRGDLADALRAEVRRAAPPR